MNSFQRASQEAKRINYLTLCKIDVFPSVCALRLSHQNPGRVKNSDSIAGADAHLLVVVPCCLGPSRALI